MKSTLLIIFFFLSLGEIKTQTEFNNEFSEPPKSMYEVCDRLQGDTLVFYYNSRYQLVKPVCAEIYRKSLIDTIIDFFDGNFTDYYIDNALALDGCYKNGRKNGTFTYYYPNGQIKSKGKYDDGIKSGTWLYWYSNGKQQQTLEFSNQDTLVMEFWNEDNKKLVDNGYGSWYTYETDEKFTKIEGKVANGYKVGKWKKSIPSRNFTMNIEKYINGKLKIGKSISMLSLSEKYDNKIYCTIEPAIPSDNSENFQLNYCFPKSINNFEYASYPGGMKSFYKEINEKFIFPESFLSSSVRGTIIIQTTITKEGKMSNFKNISDLGFGLEYEFIRVLRTMKKWKPTTNNGKVQIQPRILRYTIK